MNNILSPKLLRIASGAAIAATLSLPASADNWNVNLVGNSRAATVALEHVLGELQSDIPDLEVNVGYSEALGPAKHVPESLRSGGYEVGQICTGYYPNKLPLLNVLELPFLLPADPMKQFLVEQKVLEHPAIQKELSDRWNMRYFTSMVIPSYEFMGNKPIRSLADFQGSKIRVSGLNAEILAMFGARPTFVTVSEGYTALERGTLDVFSFPYSYAFGAFKLYEVSDYATTGVGMNGFACFFAINNDVYERIPYEVKEKLESYTKAGTEKMVQAFKEEDEKWIPIFKEHVEITEFPKEERSRLVAESEKIWNEWAEQKEAQGLPGKEVLDYVKGVVAQVNK